MLEDVKDRRGEDGRRSRAGVLVEMPIMGEVLRLSCLCSGSITEVRTGEIGGKDSSAGFRGIRTLLGDADGLPGRCWDKNRIWPEPLTPGMD